MNAKKNQQLLVVGGVVVVAVVVLVAAIALSGNANVAALDYSTMSPMRTEDGAFIIGNPDAPVTLVEFADWGCPHCMTYHTDMQRFVTEFVATGQARFEFRMFPTAGGQQTVFAGQIAECVDDTQPGSFWNLYDKLFELAKTGRYFTDNGIRGAVQELGFSYSEILSCSQSSTQVQTDVQFGSSRGVNGTPAVMVRYDNGPANWVNYAGTTYDRGSVPYEVLAAVVAQANAQ